ncbi:hypothetical protein CDAR_85011 [Caerostris darwini]|uniref:Uncharacterized protein n=1 Tax=Caerostris darwini TaxID=1538125 RepID=A0AAV4N0V0_9ARAC|nr:hypothetical protein CDAR_85011 [Caerostris darwini]
MFSYSLPNNPFHTNKNRSHPIHSIPYPQELLQKGHLAFPQDSFPWPATYRKNTRSRPGPTARNHTQPTGAHRSFCKPTVPHCRTVTLQSIPKSRVTTLGPLQQACAGLGHS